MLRWIRAGPAAGGPGAGSPSASVESSGAGSRTAPVGRPACDGGSRARPGGGDRGTGGEHGARASSTREAAAVATDGTQPRFRRRRAPCQLPVRRRAPLPSNSSASAPITGRAGTGVRSATIENCTAAALGLPPASRAAPAALVHRHGVRDRGRYRRHVARVVPAAEGTDQIRAEIHSKGSTQALGWSRAGLRGARTSRPWRSRGTVAAESCTYAVRVLSGNARCGGATPATPSRRAERLPRSARLRRRGRALG